MAETMNQCDGCRRGLPLIEGLHRGADSLDMIGCTKERYVGPKPIRDDDLRGLLKMAQAAVAARVFYQRIQTGTRFDYTLYEEQSAGDHAAHLSDVLRCSISPERALAILAELSSLRTRQQVGQ